MRHTLTPELGARFVTIALGHVTREYPNKPEHTLAGPEDARTPAGLHPVFYGSYDWHSCVHSYWLLARLLRLFPAAPQANAIRALFDQQLVPERVAGECTYLAAPTARGFKRPYGWAWLLKLAVELSGLPDSRWSEALSPLAEAFAQRFRDFLPVAPYPVRVGTHFNTAFGLRMAADYAEGTGDTALLGLLLHTAERWYGEDVDCPAWGSQAGTISNHPRSSKQNACAVCFRLIASCPGSTVSCRVWWNDNRLPFSGQPWPPTEVTARSRIWTG